jgi:hypothetical protein
MVKTQNQLKLKFKKSIEIQFLDSPQLCDHAILQFDSMERIIKILISQNLVKHPLNCDFTSIPSPDFKSIKITTEELPMSQINFMLKQVMNLKTKVHTEIRSRTTYLENVSNFFSDGRIIEFEHQEHFDVEWIENK